MRNPEPPPDLPWTILKTLQWTTAFFKSHHIDSPRLTAEVLLAHTLNIRRIDLYLRFDQPLIPPELAIYKAFIKRRAGREPLAYITGSREFYGLDFAVTPDVLIPRPETEFLVEEALRVLPQDGLTDPRRVLDLGTGSGAIIISLATQRPGHFFAASDKSMKAVSVAACNARTHRVADQIRFFAGDLFAALGPEGPGFDLIVSNPPYVAAEAMAGLEPEVRGFEPAMALDGGAKGLEVIRAILPNAFHYLKPNGVLMLEIGFDQKESIVHLAAGLGACADLRFVKDYGGHDRVAVLRRR